MSVGWQQRERRLDSLVLLPFQQWHVMGPGTSSCTSGILRDWLAPRPTMPFLLATSLSLAFDRGLWSVYTVASLTDGGAILAHSHGKAKAK